MSRVRLASYQFYILLALADKALSGAEIQQTIIGDTVGMYVRDSTLYDALANLANAGLISKSPSKVYRLTEVGRRRLEVESRTLRDAVRLSQVRLGWR
jgi:DNA-binding PadR family transcriptional regulator